MAAVEEKSIKQKHGGTNKLYAWLYNAQSKHTGQYHYNFGYHIGARFRPGFLS